MWKIADDSLENKTASVDWEFYHQNLSVPNTGEVGYIEHLDSGKVLGVVGDQNSRDTVILEDKFDDVELVQQWQRGPSDNDGFFKLKNIRTKSFLSILSETETITGMILFSTIINYNLVSLVTQGTTRTLKYL